MNLVEIFSSFPPVLATVIIASLPLAEVQAAIPIAVTVYKLDPLVAYLLAIFGSIVPAIFILSLLGPVSGYLIERFDWAKKFFDWLWHRTRHKFSGNYAKWGYLALVVFSATPLPGAGVWSGAVAAFLFGIPKKIALILLFIGTSIAGVLISLTTLGITSLF